MASKIYRKKPKRKKEKTVVNKERLKLYRKTQQQVDQVNKRLESLAREGYAGTWASRKLINRLTGSKTSKNIELVRKRGKISGIKISPSSSTTSLIAIHKASSQFLASATSTKAGIESVRKRTIDSLQKSLSDMDMELTEEDTEFLYEMLEIREMQDLTESFGASRVWDISQDAIEAKDTKEDFMKRFEREIASLNDEDMKNKANKIYEYISRKI